MDDATFTFGDPFRGEDARLAVRYMVRALSTTTVGDMMYIGQVYRSRICQRTLAGIDVNGASFTPYSTRGPYDFYPNRELGVEPHPFLHPSFYVNGRSVSGAGFPSQSCRASDGGAPLFAIN